MDVEAGYLGWLAPDERLVGGVRREGHPDRSQQSTCGHGAAQSRSDVHRFLLVGHSSLAKACDCAGVAQVCRLLYRSL
jgi:hypothetical protein